jgi:predicted permease
MMTVGYICRQYKLVSDKSLAEMNKVQFRGFMSLLIFYNIYELDPSSHGSLSLIFYAFLIIAAEIVGSYWIFRKMTKDRTKISVLIQGTYRSNLLIFGLSIAQSLYGDGNIGDTIILMSIIVPTFNVITVILFEFFRGGKIKLR